MPYKEEALHEQLAIEMFPGTEKEFWDLPAVTKTMLFVLARECMQYADRNRLSIVLDQKIQQQEWLERQPRVGDTVRFTKEALAVPGWYSSERNPGKPRPDHGDHTVVELKGLPSHDVVLDNGASWDSSWLEVVR